MLCGITLMTCFIVCRFLKHQLLESLSSSTLASLRCQPSTPLRFEAAPEVLPPDCFLWEELGPSHPPYHPVTLQIDTEQPKVKASSQLVTHTRWTRLTVQIGETLEIQRTESIKSSILTGLGRKWWTKMNFFMRQRAQMKQL